MKTRIFTVTISALLLFWVVVTTAQAVSIDFEGLPQYTSNPTIQGTSFWAGDPAQFHDTYIDDAMSPGNAYLASGFADSSVTTPVTLNTFIGVSLVPNTVLASFDILSESLLPGGDTFLLAAYLGGVQQASASLFVNDNLYHQISISAGTSFDTLYIYDQVGSFGLGQTFHIDNFSSTLGSTGPNNPVPEPSTIFLLLTGLVGTCFWRRNRTL
jgi:hypothetical protein